jgi:hypothetical protein
LFNPPPTTENPHEVVTPRNCATCSYLQLLAPTCSYLHYLQQNFCSHDLATSPFLAQTLPKSSTLRHPPPAPALGTWNFPVDSWKKDTGGF